MELSQGVVNRKVRETFVLTSLYEKQGAWEYSVFGGQKWGRNMELPPEMDVSTLKSNCNKLQLGGQCKLKILCEQDREIKQEWLRFL